MKQFRLWKMRGVKCPICDERGIERVLNPGELCPACRYPYERLIEQLLAHLERC